MKILHLAWEGGVCGRRDFLLSLLQDLNRDGTSLLACPNGEDGLIRAAGERGGIPLSAGGGDKTLDVLALLAGGAARQGPYTVSGADLPGGGEPFQLIHCHGARAALLGLRLRKATGLPLAVSLYGDWREEARGALDRWRLDAALRRAEGLIAADDCAADLLLLRGLSPRRLYTYTRRDQPDPTREEALAAQLQIYETILRRRERPRRERDGAVICGAYGQENAGDDAILEAILTELRSIDPDLPVTVLSRNPARTRLLYRVEAVHTFDLPAWYAAMGRSRLYISGGGSLIQDVTSTRSLLYYLQSIRTARRRGNKVLMYGCGIGPVEKPANRAKAARILNRYVDIITLRDEGSLTELRAMGVTAPDIRLSADPALTLAPPPPAEVDALMEEAGIPPEGRYACFIVRQWPDVERVFPALRAAAAYVYESRGLTPLFLAVERLRDPELTGRLAEGVTVPCHVLTGHLDHRAIIGLLGRMGLVISMRLHSLIFAAGQGVPLVGLVYDPKVSAFLRYMGQEQCLALDQMEEGSLREMIDAALDRSPQEQEAAVARLLDLERRNVEAAAELLR